MAASPALSFLFLCLTLTLALGDMSTIVSHEEENNEVMAMYEEWLVKNRKVYNGLGEKERRFEAFKDNLKFIKEHNARENTTYKLGLNRFADLKNEEYRALYLGTRVDPKRSLMKAKNTASNRYAHNAHHGLPKHVDWRLKGAVNAVKDQGACGN